MNNLAKQERRLFPRAQYSCRLLISNSGEVIEGNTENLGAGGICVALKKELTRNASISMEIFIEPNRALKCEGYVAWVLKRLDAVDNKTVFFDTGVKFFSLRENDRAYLSKLVERINAAKAG
jgi:hypothetical protein